MRVSLKSGLLCWEVNEEVFKFNIIIKLEVNDVAILLP